MSLWVIADQALLVGLTRNGSDNGDYEDPPSPGFGAAENERGGVAVRSEDEEEDD